LKVLIVTNDLTFSVALSSEYLRRGFDVHVGTTNFFRREQDFDLIHFQWPEELVNWILPTTPQSEKLALDCLDWWKSRSTLICTVHNLLPHSAKPGRGPDYELYKKFYNRMDHIGHFSNSSLDVVSGLFPDIPIGKHFVHGMNSFENLKSLASGRTVARRKFAFSENSFVISTYGNFRVQSEVLLVRNAINQLKIEDTGIVFAGRLPWINRRLSRAYARFQHERWVKRHSAIQIPGHIEDQKTVDLFEAADAIVIPRSGQHLNSGILPLAMTFGTPVIAPNFGVFREGLQESENELYEPGDAKDLAAAITRLSQKPTDSVRSSNLDRFKDWGWKQIIDSVLGRLN
jgi:glycosyltransferase involved in cell wall biosynthesis